jgi:hypothetical protein
MAHASTITMHSGENVRWKNLDESIDSEQTENPSGIRPDAARLR